MGNSTVRRSGTWKTPSTSWRISPSTERQTSSRKGWETTRKRVSWLPGKNRSSLLTQTFEEFLHRIRLISRQHQIKLHAIILFIDHKKHLQYTLDRVLPVRETLVGFGNSSVLQYSISTKFL